MAKKPSSGPTLKSILRKYLNEDCFIQKEPKHENYEFIFEVKYPKIKDEKGNQKGRAVAILKPKKKNYLEISNKIFLKEEDLNVVNELEINQRAILNNEIKFYLIRQNLLQSINLDKNDLYYLDKLYFNNSGYPGMNELYHSIIKVINSQIVVMDILNRHLGILNENKLNTESKDSYFQ